MPRFETKWFRQSLRHILPGSESGAERPALPSLLLLERSVQPHFFNATTATAGVLPASSIPRSRSRTGSKIRTVCNWLSFREWTVACPSRMPISSALSSLPSLSPSEAKLVTKAIVFPVFASPMVTSVAGPEYSTRSKYSPAGRTALPQRTSCGSLNLPWKAAGAAAATLTYKHVAANSAATITAECFLILFIAFLLLCGLDRSDQFGRPMPRASDAFQNHSMHCNSSLLQTCFADQCAESKRLRKSLRAALEDRSLRPTPACVIDLGRFRKRHLSP